jgi:hypothetical protein
MLGAMSTAPRSFSSLPGPVKRLIYSAFGIALFLSVSSMLHPERSMAEVRDNAAMKQSHLVPVADAGKVGAGMKQTPIQPPVVTSARPLLGTLVGSPYFVWVYAGANGPLYTVADRQGKILVTEVNAETLYAELPEVSVQTLQLQPGAPGPLMMVDPDSQR